MGKDKQQGRAQPAYCNSLSPTCKMVERGSKVATIIKVLIMDPRIGENKERAGELS
jgi:hypothetical protein